MSVAGKEDIACKTLLKMTTENTSSEAGSSRKGLTWTEESKATQTGGDGYFLEKRLRASLTADLELFALLLQSADGEFDLGVL